MGEPIQQPPSTEREALYRAVATLGTDELRVLTAIACRLQMGREQYGTLMLARDKRDWGRECAEELQDAAIYASCALLTLRETHRDRS